MDALFQQVGRGIVGLFGNDARVLCAKACGNVAEFLLYVLRMKIELLEQLRIERAEMFCHEAVQAVEVLKKRVETE